MVCTAHFAHCADCAANKSASAVAKWCTAAAAATVSTGEATVAGT